jgi:c-di-GMP-related signal transduction protein
LAIGLDPRQAVSVARQPIFDRRGQIIAHELPYRHAPEATACNDAGDLAGARTLSDAYRRSVSTR